MIKDTDNNVLGKVTIEPVELNDIWLKKDDIDLNKFILELDRSNER